jgi:hypothetical protein
VPFLQIFRIEFCTCILHSYPPTYVLRVSPNPSFFASHSNNIDGRYAYRLWSLLGVVLLSMGLWRWYSNITVKILDIINCPVFYLKHNVPDTETSSICWAGLSRFHLKTETESNLRKVLKKRYDDG